MQILAVLNNSLVKPGLRLAACHETHQSQACQQRGIGFGLGNRRQVAGQIRRRGFIGMQYARNQRVAGSVSHGHTSGRPRAADGEAVTLRT